MFPFCIIYRIFDTEVSCCIFHLMNSSVDSWTRNFYIGSGSGNNCFNLAESTGFSTPKFHVSNIFSVFAMSFVFPSIAEIILIVATFILENLEGEIREVRALEATFFIDIPYFRQWFPPLNSFRGNYSIYDIKNCHNWFFPNFELKDFPDLTFTSCIILNSEVSFF